MIRFWENWLWTSRK